MPGKGFNAMLRLYSPLEPFFTKAWRPSEIEELRPQPDGDDTSLVANDS